MRICGDRLVVRPEPDEPKGAIILTSNPSPFTTGTVLAVGDGKECWVAWGRAAFPDGTRILYRKSSVEPVDVGLGDDTVLVPTNAVMAVLD